VYSLSPDDWATREVGGSLRSVQHVQDQSNTLRKHMASLLGLGLGAKGRYILDFFFKKDTKYDEHKFILSFNDILQK
jgi:hypothetical protein